MFTDRGAKGQILDITPHNAALNCYTSFLVSELISTVTNQTQKKILLDDRF